ncbi:MAG: PqqD family peptide modification chaperone [Oscillospiraceae bacterium]
MKISNDLVWRKIDNCIVIEHIDDYKSIYTMQGASVLIFELIEKNYSYNQIVDSLTDEFGSTYKNQIELDVENLVHAMKKLQIIV